ncbi:MAG: BtrH N-terminal domain-containing protein [Spirochaetota bacterium]
MKQSVLFSCAAVLLGSCNNAWNIGGTTEAILLPGASAITGRHCESSAISNALNYLGYPIEECLITGAGGALGFGFDRNTFPFMSARNGDMREQFFKVAGIPWEKSADDLENSPDYGWKQINAVLSQGLPVILRVDMRYLPYLYGGKYGSAYTSFGWHMICLFGIDWPHQEALVTDTAMPGLQRIALKDLHEARSSKLKVMPPQGEFYWVTEKADGYSPDWESLLQHSLRLVTSYYENDSLAALERYGQDLVELESYSKQSFLLPAVLEFMAGNIEDFGTGGAAFRMLYRDFLQLMADRLDTSELENALSILGCSIEAWHKLSAAFRSLAGRIKSMKADQRALEYQKLKITADTIYKQEQLFYAELKNCIQEN